MTVSDIKLNATSLSQVSQLQQMPEYMISDTQESQYVIDCYPYAMRGFLWGLCFSIVILTSAIGVLTWLF